MPGIAEEEEKIIIMTSHPIPHTTYTLKKQQQKNILLFH
jgi:hypothetical protein